MVIVPFVGVLNSENKENVVVVSDIRHSLKCDVDSAMSLHLTFMMAYY
mgnify:CR=1 FL=1